ncbi:hypothetical protein Q7C36_021521 [Tachysurus vachellii]|uniref:Uncharacterized protein n=1 Tax=Tachysurus vachellii TaxID=175792 RepID=A0AA88LQQ3_TACVA|nr:hypothetical protein Q7C36_021521 [Tachysurus vachellii]
MGRKAGREEAKRRIGGQRRRISSPVTVAWIKGPLSSNPYLLWASGCLACQEGGSSSRAKKSPTTKLLCTSPMAACLVMGCRNETQLWVKTGRNVFPGVTLEVKGCCFVPMADWGKYDKQ